MDTTKKCPYSRHSNMGTTTERKLVKLNINLNLFDNCKSRVFAPRIQGCLPMVLQGFQRNTSSHCSTLDWAKFNDIAFPSKLVLDESQLCSYGQTRFGQIFYCRIHCSNGIINLMFTPIMVVPKKNGKLHMYINFWKLKCNHKEGSTSFAIHGRGLGYGS